MKFVFDFIEIYFTGLFYLWPIVLALLAVITGLGLRIGRLERWTNANALYFAFITATSVGYGDFHPTRHESKWLAIIVALTGILLTGLIVAVGLEAVAHAFRESRGVMAPIAP